MPNLSELTDYEPASPTAGLQRVYINGTPTAEVDQPVEQPSAFSNKVDKVLNSLFRDDEKRYQLWPEKVVRKGLSAAGDVATGKVPQWQVDNETGDVHTSPQMVEKAQEISALAGTGGLAGGAEGAALNATPSLRPALKYKDKLYKGKPGQEHQDVIPKELYPEFQQMAMSGEDISHYNFGFVNDKGHFLSREDALKYGIDNGLIDPHAGKFGALTSTLMADSSKPGTAIEAMAKTQAPTFFSAVEHNVNAIPQAKMTGEQWLGTLANKPGVKGEELDWTGLKGFLEENKGKQVSKEQIQEHLAANKVELKEVSKGANPDYKPLTPKEEERLQQLRVLRRDDFHTPEQIEFRNLTARSNQTTSDTKYHSYQLPGGENYREMLLTLPQGKEVHDINLMHYMRKYPQVAKEFKTVEDIALAQKFGDPALRENLKGLSPEEVLATARASEKPASEPYRSSHWDEPNILAHVRMNDRTIDGKKSLHLEEIQSDWHQQGRDKGYKGNELTAADLEKASNIAYQNLSAKLKEAQPDLDQRAVYRLADSLIEKVREGERDSFHTKHEHELAKGFVDKEAAYLKHSEAAERAKVPDAPFKKSWHELALKRMIREAAEKGYDRLSWTPGEAQAARYDLSKSVDKVSWIPETNELIATKDGKSVMHQQNVTADKLSDYVGKDVAKKLSEAPDTKGVDANKTPFKQLSGLELKIGGEGMKGFYDQIIPKAIEKLGKEHGVKVKQGKIEAGYKNLKDTEKQKHDIHYIDIPPSLRDTAMYKGFPLFSKGGYMLQPVDHDPFEDKKK